MCASTHWLASSSAQAVLERGGNAFDAAVAGAFVLHVVEPHLNGPGGDMTAVFATAEDPTPTRARRSGPRAGRGDDRALPGRGPRPGPRRRRTRRRRTRRRRRVAAAPARPRHLGADRRAVLRDRLRRGRARAHRPGQRDDRHDAGPVHRALAELRRGVDAARPGARPRRGRHPARLRRDAATTAGDCRRGRYSRGAHRRGPARSGAAASSRRRSRSSSRRRTGTPRAPTTPG